MLDTTYSQKLLSVYRHAQDNQGFDKAFTIQDIVSSIKSEQYKGKTEKLRSLTNPNDKTEYKKTNFVGVTWSGLFAPKRASNNLQQHSGLICIDIDKLEPDQLLQFKEWIIADDHTFICFTSPNGNGLKVVIKVDIGNKPEFHKALFIEIKTYYQDCYNIAIDASGKNVDRLCFLPYDPQLYINPNSEVFCLTEQHQEETEQSAPNDSYATDTEIFSWCLEVQGKKQSFVNGNRNYFITCLANFCNEYGVNKQTLLEECINHFEEQDFTEREIRSTIESVYQKTSQHGIKTYQKPTGKKDNFDNKNAKNSNAAPKNLFVVQPASCWLEQANLRPIPKMLFGECWFEGELCIFFADTNLGKSILAVQIGDSISKGIAIKGFSLEAERQKILYFDFELSDKQFENRYSLNYQDHYPFDAYFLRAEINADCEFPEGYTSFDDYLSHSLEEEIKRTGTRVLIIDNLTYLRNETERAKDALPLMKHLKALKSKYGLSILALAHTPKRDLSKPLTRNDLQGSKMLMNFCDSAFTIGESHADKNLRYLKQIKQRNTDQIYDSENVCVFQIDKPYNFLRFEFLDYGTEREHLKQISESEKSELDTEIKDLLQTDPNLTDYNIAKKLCRDESKFNSFKVKVTRIVNKIRNGNN